MKKRFFLLIPAILLVLFIGCFLYLYPTADTRLFQQVTEDFFAASLSGDSLSLHYTLADPSAYLDEPSPAVLPVYTRAGQDTTAALLENLLSSLREISPERLSSHDRYTYSLLVPWLENELAGARCLYFEEPLSPTSGIHTELPILLAEYTFRSREDVDNYLDILESIPAYLEGFAAYEKEKASAGLFMTEADASAVVEQCDRILDPALLDAGEHFLQTTFSERLDELIAEGLMDSNEKAALISENNRLLSTVAAPAYVSLADQIFLLSGSDTFQGSVCLQKGGTAYYLYLLKRNTGSSRTPEEIKELLSRYLQELFADLQSSLQEYQALTGSLPEGELTLSTFPLQTPDAILEDLQIRIQKDFPDLAASALGSRKSLFAASDTVTGTLSCAVKSVDPALETYTSPAFYLTPPIDDLTKNVIYINEASTLPGLDLYTTLAHEGYPGHLYQTVYSQSHENSRTDNPIRSILYYGGFVEGWAYYVENLAYDYAADVLLESKASSADRLLPRIACLERNLQINLYCLLDLAIHYYGSDREEVFQTLASFGITDPETAASIYNYIRLEPTTYLKYYLGYIEILELQKKAEEIWGTDYTPLRFHTFLLETGPSDFDNLNRQLEN